MRAYLKSWSGAVCLIAISALTPLTALRAIGCLGCSLTTIAKCPHELRSLFWEASLFLQSKVTLGFPLCLPI